MDCMVALPGQLFYSTQIPTCTMGVLKRDPENRFKGRKPGDSFNQIPEDEVPDRPGARASAKLKEIAKIAETYHAWRGDLRAGNYTDVPGFCKSAKVEEMRKNGYVLTPGRYVGAEAQEDDGEPFEEKMQRLTAKLAEQFR